MTYNIVEVVPGKYAIRRRTYWQELFNREGDYLDLTEDCPTWWNRKGRYGKDCLTADANILTDKLALLKSIPKVIS